MSNILQIPDIVVVIGAGPVSEATLLAIASTNARVIVVDFTSLESFATAKLITALPTNPKVVAVGIEDRDDQVLACAEAGISGYVPREASIKDFQRVIHDVMHDRFVCSPLIAAALVRRIAQLSKAPAFNSDILTTHLTDRQRQIASLLGRGLTNKEIGRSLSIRSSTVRNHVHAIFEKLNVRRRAEAVALLHVNGCGLTIAEPRTTTRSDSGAPDAHGHA